MAIKRKLLAIVICVLMLINIVGCAECEHQWGKLKLISESTCTVQGVKERTCELCGEVKSVNLPLTAHKWKTATCTTPKTCKECNLVEGKPLGHVFNKKIQGKSACMSNTGPPPCP